MAGIRQIKGILIDLSGTIHVESTVIPGSIEAIKSLREAKVPLRFVTNTTKESKQFLLKRLSSIGFDIQPGEIFTSLLAARELVERQKLRPMLFLEKEAMEDFEGLEMEDANAVVIGLAPTKFHYEELNKAFRLVLEKGAPLIAINKGRYHKRTDGLALGPGAFAAAIEFASGAQARVVGKPEKDFFLEGLRPFNCTPEETIMIGDDVKDDVGGAQALGITGVLVRTGKYRPNDEAKISPAPNYIFNNFAAAVDYLIRNDMKLPR